MKTTIEVDLKWWHFNQNNSGGYFIDNDVVSHDVCVQARDAVEAQARAEKIFEPYSQYCGCCGERWYINCFEEDGADAPEIYGDPISEITKSLFHKTCVLHHFDGRVEKVEYKDAPNE